MTQRVEVAKVCAAVMASPLAEDIQQKLPAIDITALVNARAEAFRKIEAEEDPPVEVEEPAMGLDGTACLPQLTGDAVRSVPPTVSRPVSSSRQEVAKNHRGKAPLFPEIASRPASALAPQTRRKWTSSSSRSKRQAPPREGQAGHAARGYSGSDAQSEALFEVKACLTHDEGDLRTFKGFCVSAKAARRAAGSDRAFTRELNITASTEVERLRRMHDLEKAHDDNSAPTAPGGSR